MGNTVLSVDEQEIEQISEGRWPAMPGPGSPTYLGRRWTAAVISATLLIAALIYTVYTAFSTSLAAGLTDIKYNELTSESIKGRVDFSRSLFQVGLLVTAALWGLIIAKKDEARIVFSDKPEITMFWSSCALLILSLVDHSIYLHYISQIYAVAGQALGKGADPTMPDVFDATINQFYIFQIVYLVLGSLVAVITLISAHRLKEGHQ
jgi:hypothetical protein